MAGDFEILKKDEPLDLSWVSLSLGDRVADASLKPAREDSLFSYVVEQHWGKVVLGSTEAGSGPVGPHAQGMTEGSTHFYLNLVFGRVSGLNFHHLFPLDPVL